MEQSPFASPPEASTPINQDQKYCRDCGKIILRRAEICPVCGCRQMPVPASRNRFTQNFFGNSEPTSRELESSFVTKMAILLCLNFLWNGLGNLAIGDKRGWGFGFFNWIIVAIGFFTLWIPPLLFFAYCGYVGHQFLVAPNVQEAMCNSGASSFTN